MLRARGSRRCDHHSPPTLCPRRWGLGPIRDGTRCVCDQRTSRHARIGDETIVLSLPSSRYFTITGVGIRVFELLAEERPLDDLVGTIVGEYEVDPMIARRDIEAFLDRLHDAELVQ